MPGEKIYLTVIQTGTRAREDAGLNFKTMLEKNVRMKNGFIVFPEYQFEPFFVDEIDCAGYELAKSADCELRSELSSLAKEYSSVIIAPFFEKAMEGVFYYSAYIMDADGTLAGIYRKNHIRLSHGFQEKYYFKPGNSGYPVFRTKYGNIGVLLSYDMAFPETSRILALSGADIIVIPAAFDMEFAEIMRVFAASEAASNGVFLAMACACGESGNVKFSGRSAVFGPDGMEIASLDGAPSVLSVEIDFDKLKEVREAHPFFRDRRPEGYQALVEARP